MAFFHVLFTLAAAALVTCTTSRNTIPSTDIVCLGRVPNQPFSQRPTAPNSAFGYDRPATDLLDLCAAWPQLVSHANVRSVYGWRAGLQCVNGELNNESLRSRVAWDWDITFYYAADANERMARENEYEAEMARLSDLENYCRQRCLCRDGYLVLELPSQQSTANGPLERTRPNSQSGGTTQGATCERRAGHRSRSCKLRGPPIFMLEGLTNMKALLSG